MSSCWRSERGGELLAFVVEDLPLLLAQVCVSGNT